MEERGERKGGLENGKKRAAKGRGRGERGPSCRRSVLSIIRPHDSWQQG